MDGAQGREAGKEELAKDDDCDVDRAENTELVGLLEETILALGNERSGNNN